MLWFSVSTGPTGGQSQPTVNEAVVFLPASRPFSPACIYHATDISRFVSLVRSPSKIQLTHLYPAHLVHLGMPPTPQHYHQEYVGPQKLVMIHGSCMVWDGTGQSHLGDDQ